MAVALILAVSSVAMGMLLIEPAPKVPAQVATPKWAPVAEPAASVETPVVEAPPVRVRNPFDKTEVFEFPAGTSKAAARDAVAETLMQRARERNGTS